MVFALIVVVVALHAALAIGLCRFPFRREWLWRFHVPAVVLAWIAYLWYEGVYLPAHCTGECNIRVDLLLIWPCLAWVSGVAVFYATQSRRRDRSRTD